MIEAPGYVINSKKHLEENFTSTQAIECQSSQDNEEIGDDQIIQAPPLSKTKGK